MKSIIKTLSIVASLIGVLVPFVGVLNPDEVYKSAFLIYKMRVEVALFSICALFVLNYSIVKRGLGLVFDTLAVGGYDRKAQAVIFFGSGGIALLLFFVVPAWADLERWLTKRVQYVDQEIARDYNNFVDYLGSVKFATGRLSAAKAHWQSIESEEQSYVDALLDKIEIVDSRKAYAAALLISAEQHQRRFGSENLLSYRLAVQALVADPDNQKARDLLENYLERIVEARKAPCLVNNQWYLTGSSDFNLDNCEEFKEFGNPDNKWLLEEVRSVLADIDAAGIEGGTLGVRVTDFNQSVVDRSTWRRTDQSFLQRYSERLGSFGNVEQDLFVEASDDEFFN